jgi:hypothetical protein
MTPGPIVIKSCPHCNQPFKILTIDSGNTFGATIWTDGNMIAPMWIEYPLVIKCPSCGRVFWEEEARKIGQAAGFYESVYEDLEMIEEIDPEAGNRIRQAEKLKGLLWGRVEAVNEELQRNQPLAQAVNKRIREIHRIMETAKGYEKPNKEDLGKALDSGMGDTKGRELYLRILAWWRSNDKWRRNTNNDIKRTEEEYQNMVCLFDLLGQKSPDDRLMKAEVARELGRFSEAIELLDIKFPEGYESTASLIRAFAKGKDCSVHLVEKGELFDNFQGIR